MSKFITTTTIN